MRAVVPFAAVLWLLSAITAQAASLAIPPSVVVPDLPLGTEVRPVTFTRAVTKMTRGQQWGTIAGGLLCVGATKLVWEGGGEADIDDLTRVFHEEATKAGFKVDGDPDNLFEAASASSDYAVAASISAINARLCAPFTGLGDQASLKGAIVMNIEWQIYSRLEKRMVAKIETTGGFETKQAATGAIAKIGLAAFAENVRGLVASDGFRKAVIGPANQPAAPVQLASLTPISLTGPKAPAKRAISDAVGSVVSIFAGDGMGSGFLVSSEGYLITNYHVVGEAKYVKVRWSDGFESVGEVIRSDKRRDVALVKTDPHGRQALALRRGTPQPGEAVFAIGTPLDENLQNTVTKGIVSATRIMDGFSFIQSDVAVTHGNSGGPLLDEAGAVVGITVSGRMVNEAQVGLNFFIPIGDALDFLALRSAP